MSLIKKLAGETALYGLSSIIGRFLNVVLVPLYTNIFPKAEYGVVIDLYASSAFLMVLYSYRMESAFFRFGHEVPERDRSYSTGMYSLLVTSGILTGLVFLFARPIAGLLQYADHVEYVRYFALILAFDCLAELPFARLRLEQRPVRFAVAKLFNIGLNIGLNLFWILFCPWADAKGWHWVRAVWMPGVGLGYIFVSNVVASAATLLLLLPECRAVFRARFDAIRWREMMYYGLPLVLVSMAGIVNEMLDRAILKYLLPGTHAENMAEVGVYGANYKLAMLITLFTQAYRYAAEPFFFRTARRDDALELQAGATKWFSIVACAGVLAIMLFLDIVRYFIGKEFWGGLHVVPILLMANILLGLYYNFSAWYRLLDRTRTGAWVSLGGAGITLVLNLWLAPRYGYVASAWITLVCYLFMSGATWWLGRKVYPVPYALGRIGMYIGVVWGLWLIEQGVAATGVLPSAALWLLRVLLMLAYFGWVWVWEKQEIRQMFRR
jgi:O-antigen/teichoic acid export membrane protein